MTLLFGILLTLVVFTIIVFIHELGHFVTARWTGMKVEEFGIGIPPKAKILGKDAKGTEYTLNWLPIGGFVRIKGEDPGAEDSLSKDAFSSKKWWARSLVLLAGVTMNFILAFFILSGLFLIGVKPLLPNVFNDKEYHSLLIPSQEQAITTGYLSLSGIVLSPLPDSPAAKAGIQKGDKVLFINEENATSIQAIIEVIKMNQQITLAILRNNEVFRIPIYPIDGKIGVSLAYESWNLDQNYQVRLRLDQAFIAGFLETYRLSYFTLDMLGETFIKLVLPKNETEQKEALNNVAGPIALGSTFVTIVEKGWNAELIFLLVALLSINLGVMNLLPFPALDGGRFVSTTFRSIIGMFTTRKTLLNTLEYSIHAFGMIFLLALSLLIAILDITKIFSP